MRIGIAYDTKDMYSVPEIYNDFADEHCIRALQRELEKNGYDVTLLGNAPNIIELLKKGSLDCDIVYNTAEGVSSRNREEEMVVSISMYSISACKTGPW
mgnify:CR=1 FL=1|jgi:soluble P-type ATPase